MAEGVIETHRMAEASQHPLLFERTDGVVWLTLNRPAQYNALSEELLAALNAAVNVVTSAVISVMPMAATAIMLIIVIS